MIDISAAIFPRQINNTYRGHAAGVWLFALIVLLKLIMGSNSVINTRAVATGADGIPLDSLGSGAADTVVSLFALLGLGQVVLAALGVVVLVRYRAMIPLMFLLLLVDHLGRKAVALVHPVAAVTSSVSFYINLGVLTIILMGGALSLNWRADEGRSP